MYANLIKRQRKIEPNKKSKCEMKTHTMRKQFLCDSTIASMRIFVLHKRRVYIACLWNVILLIAHIWIWFWAENVSIFSYGHLLNRDGLLSFVFSKRKVIFWNFDYSDVSNNKKKLLQVTYYIMYYINNLRVNN